MINAVFFDIDNTLVDRDTALRRLLEARARDVVGGLAVEQIMHRDASGHGDRERFYSWLAEHHPTLGETPDKVRETLLRGIPAAVEPDATVTTLLAQLAARCSIVVVSNGGSVTQREKLRRAGLRDHVEHLFISEELGVAKPAGEIFRRALAAVGCAPEQAIHVGDHPEQDIAGALEMGLRTCWIARGRSYPATLPTPTWSVRRVTDLPEVLPC